MFRIINLHRLAISFAMFAVVALGSLATARAETFTFSGSPNGKPVTATATITQTGNVLQIVLTNNTANIQDVGQAITDFSFKINGVTLTGTTAFSASGRGIFVAADGTFSDIGTSGNDDLTLGGDGSIGKGWTLSSTGPGTFYLNALGTGQPNFGILGPPNGSSVYSSANNSIAGNDAHNPFAMNTATFTFTITGGTLPAGVTFSDVFMSFGTEPGHNLPPIPEPASMLLFGTGLFGAVAIARRLFRK